MPIQRSAIAAAPVLYNPGKESVQIVWPETAPDAHATVTRVIMDPGAVSPRHQHARSEQIWIVEKGTATLLLAGGAAETMEAGDVVRTPAGEVHGVENTGLEPFVYLTVTVPPEDMTSFYEDRRNGDPETFVDERR